MSAWLVYALLSALCAAFVSIFGKVGLMGLDSSAATAVRAAIMALFLMGVVVAEGHAADLPPTERRLPLSHSAGLQELFRGSFTSLRSRTAQSRRWLRSTS